MCIMTKYEKGKERARALAIDWSLNVQGEPMSWAEAAAYATKFERLGRRYGLLREFRENAIC